MKTFRIIALALAAALLPACNDQKPASAMPTPAPGESHAPTAAAPAENPAGGTTGGAGGQYPSESTKSYPPTKPAN